MTALRKPVGRAGRGPGRHRQDARDYELWTHAVCGRVLPPGYLDAAPGATGPDKTPPLPPNSPFSE